MTQLSQELELEGQQESPLLPRLELAIIILLRLVSALFLALALLVWLRAIGFWAGDSFRFDTMSPAARVYIAVLAVLFPVTSVGLWTTLAWGRVVWFLAVIIELLAFSGFFGDVGVNVPLLATHAFCVGLYIILRSSAYFIAKKG